MNVDGAPLALQEDRGLVQELASALRVLARARGCAGALATELLAPEDRRASTAEQWHQAAAAGHRLARRICEVDGIRVTVRGELPRGPVVLTCNHLSYLDPIVLGALLPLTAIGKSELASWPIVGRACRRIGTLFVRRASVHHGAVVLRQALHRLAAGIPVLNFPEGTTTDGSGPLLPFRRGIFGLALRAGVPVVPVALRLDPPDAAWVGGAAFLPHYARLTARAAVQATVRFGTPVDCRIFPSAEHAAAAVHENVQSLLGGAR